MMHKRYGAWMGVLIVMGIVANIVIPAYKIASYKAWYPELANTQILLKGVRDIAIAMVGLLFGCIAAISRWA